MPEPATTKTPSTRAFAGFQRPHEIVTPNQFFDVVLPHHSTPVIRVVGFLMRETLGFTNDDGDPFQERFQFAQREIAEGAGVPASAVKEALDQAVAARFLNEVRPAIPARAGQAASPAVYELCWHEYPDGQYVVDPRKFRGFFAAEGNRTSIPEEFFHEVLPHNTKAVIRFVGAVIRNTLGIKASHGRGRVKRARLSYAYLERYLQLTSHSLSNAIKKAMAKNYVIRLERGVFDARNPDNRRQAIYTVKWCQSPTPRVDLRGREAEHTKNSSDPTPKTPAGIRTKNSSPYKGFPEGNHLKQQACDAAAKVDLSLDQSHSVKLLRGIGYQQRDALQLATRYSLETIRRQIAWLEDRQPKNPLALLRSALEGDWAAPARSLKETSSEAKAEAFARGFYAGRWGQDHSESCPSLRDLRAAQHLLTKLTEIHGAAGAEEALRWGRGFGRAFAKSYPKLIPSLAHAAGVLVDDLLQAHRRQARAKELSQQFDRPPSDPVSPAMSSERKAWYAYLAQREPQLRQLAPEAMAAFEKDRVSQRQRIGRSGMPSFVARMLEVFDSSETRLRDLQRAFPHHLQDFETWRAASAAGERPFTH